MSGNAEKVAKRPLSEAQLAARRANAQKSTGPKNTERSRFNRLTHGLRATLPVLPGESQQAYDQRLARWMEDRAPQDDMQQFLVRRAVDLSFKLERGDAVEHALALDLMTAAAQGGEGDPAEVEHLGAQVFEGCAAAARRLGQSSRGCLWLLDQWKLFHQAIQDRGRLYGTERKNTLRLLERQVTDVLKNDPVAIKWFTVLVGMNCPDGFDKEQTLASELGGRPPAGMHPSEFEARVEALAAKVPTQEESVALLQTYIPETIAELENRLELVRELEEARRAIAVQRSRIDLSEKGKQVLRHQVSTNGSFHAALRRLEAMQNPRQPRPPGRPRKIQSPGATAGTSAAVATEAQPSTTASGQANGSFARAAAVSDVPTSDATAQNQAAVATAAKSDGLPKNPGAVTTDAKCDDSPKNPGAVTTEAKCDAQPKNPGAVTTEAKNDAQPKNPGAVTTEAKNQIFQESFDRLPGDVFGSSSMDSATCDPVHRDAERASEWKPASSGPAAPSLSTPPIDDGRPPTSKWQPRSIPDHWPKDIKEALLVSAGMIELCEQEQRFCPPTAGRETMHPS